jgi:outer membrane protein
MIRVAFNLWFKPLPVKFRIGFAEGLSFANPVPSMEQREMDTKEFRSSKLLNYLDFSFGLNMGDIFRADSVQDLWFGYSIHHRSGIFTSSSAFGRIKGGSNYQTVYLQYHF